MLRIPTCYSHINGDFEIVGRDTTGYGFVAALFPDGKVGFLHGDTEGDETDEYHLVEKDNPNNLPNGASLETYFINLFHQMNLIYEGAI
jgi:hypothetical protein